MQSTMENYSDYTKQLYKSIDLIESKRANSAKPIKIRGIKYKFQLQNVMKYQDMLKYGKFDWKVKYQSLGRKVPKRGDRKKALVREIHFDTLLRILQKTDWAMTPLYQIF